MTGAVHLVAGPPSAYLGADDVGEERLAWPVDPAAGEKDRPEAHAVPAPDVVAALRRGELAVRL